MSFAKEPTKAEVNFNDPQGVAKALNAVMIGMGKELEALYPRMVAIASEAESDDPEKRAAADGKVLAEIFNLVRGQTERQLVVCGALMTLLLQCKSVVVPAVNMDPRFLRNGAR